MEQLSAGQRELVASLVGRLGAIRGVEAVVLGGSHARGRAREGSDIDLGLLYSAADPFDIGSVRELAREVNDEAGPVVSGFYEWGPWVNGGAWLVIDGWRVDLLYRGLEQIERVIAESEAGRYEVDLLQQPPFGFFSGTYLGEVAACIPLLDPGARVEALKRKVADYPEALRRAVVGDSLFRAEFAVAAFAPKFAARSDTYGVAACLARAVNELVMALFALNREYPVNDKTALEEIAEFGIAPGEFGPRVQGALAHLGASADGLAAAVEEIGELVGEAAELAGGLHRRGFAPPE